ncbi:hypothetical protein QAD02_021041 [Eretmocerus hayati]|uniref:Uncharacterized protein n=1 Tax=Eretmocerus hayati TaxID=131215 RepID=A0ACC2PQ56_9HYME|nr:hypothetical protein QAD02_021041 [Eretmocerus hayati]
MENFTKINRKKCVVKMENLLIVWMQDMIQKKIPLSGAAISFLQEVVQSTINVAQEIGGEGFSDMQDSDVLSMVSTDRIQLTASDIEEILEDAEGNRAAEKNVEERLISKAHKNHLRKIESDINIDCRNFWIFVYPKESSNEITVNIRFGTIGSKDASSTVSVFTKYFSSFYNSQNLNDEGNSNTNERIDQPILSTLITGRDGIKEDLQSTKNNLGLCLDGTHAYFVEKYAPYLAEPLRI